MVEINGKHLCENCFEETAAPVCAHCGYNAAANMSDPTMLTPGSVLLGKYIVGKVMGKGGFGVTYLAYDVVAGRKVAIKEFFPYGVALRATGTTTVSVASMDNAEAFKLGAEKFYNEAKLVSRFNGNPNIVGVYEFFYENDTVYFAMEYLKGHTLKEHIQEHGTLSAGQAMFIAQNIANALMAAHSSNVLHRDISPDNIILCDNGEVKLIDFGAARQVVAEHSQSFSVILKPGFAPLEQYQKKGKQGPWTDIYSLGATIYYALTEDIPEDPMSRLDDDEAYSSNQYNIAPELWSVIAKATELKVEDRYGDIFRLKNDLAKIPIEPEPVIVPNEENAEKVPNFQTALPFGMTQTGSQPEKQPAAVAAGGVVGNTVQSIGNSGPQGAAQPRGSFNIKELIEKHKRGSFDIKEFVKKHKRTVFAAAGALVVVIALAIIIPVSISSSLAKRYPDSANKNSAVINVSGSLSDPDASNYKPDVIIPSDKIYYSSLNSKYKPLYEIIYDGIDNRRKEIKVPSSNYTGENINFIYYMVMYDNPQFYYVSDYTLSGKTLMPTYTDVNSSINLIFAGELQEFSTTGDESNAVEELRTFHDALISKVKSVNRYSTETSSSLYGAMFDRVADDMGLSKAFCYLAQERGFKCLVVDGTVNGEMRSWCRVNIDGTWYNVDVYGDMTAGSKITRVDYDETKTYFFHTYFLTNDEYMKYCAYTPNNDYNFLLSNEFAANSDYANYYISDGINGNEYSFYYDVDKAYERTLSWAAERYQDGYYESSIRVASFIVDDVINKTNNNLINDLWSIYGITVYSYSASYDLETSRRTITLNP